MKGCQDKTGDSKQIARGILAAIGMTFGTLVPAFAETRVPVACLITPLDTVDLAAPVEGVVAEVYVDRGDRVIAGQEVARLDTGLESVAIQSARTRADSAFAVTAAQARVTFLEAAAARTESLLARKAVSQAVAEEALMEAEAARQNLQQAALERRIAELDLATALARLEQKILRAPIDGLITARDVSPGEYMDGRSRIVTIARTDVLRVEAFVPISYYPFLGIGQSVTIRPEDPIGGQYKAEIFVIDQVFDAGSGTFGVLAELQNADNSLPSGLRCMMDFQPG